MIEGSEFAGLQDDLEVSRPTSPLDGLDFRLDDVVPAGQKGTSIDHHVDLICPSLHGRGDLRQSSLDGGLTAWKGGGNARNLDISAGKPGLRSSDH